MTDQEILATIVPQFLLRPEHSEWVEWLRYGLLSLRNRLVLHSGNIRDGMTEEACELNKALASCGSQAEAHDVYERHEAYWVDVLNDLLSILDAAQGGHVSDQ